MLLVAPQLVATLFIDFLFSPPRVTSGERTSLFPCSAVEGAVRQVDRQ